MSKDLQSVAVEYVASPSEKTRTAVVMAAIPLVRSIVGRLSIPDHPLATREDLESVGQLGLLQALEGFDPERGTPFVSYAYGRVRGALVDYLRSIDALPRERRRMLAQAHHTMDVLRQELGEEPSDMAVADKLEMTMIEYHTLLRDAQCRFSLSLHSPIDGEGDQTVLESIPNKDTLQAFEAIDTESLKSYIGTLIKELPEREQTILALYYFENLTLREIAGLMDRTEARISQILAKVLKTLRAQLAQVSSKAA
ncbi:MAG: sigma-70 family RNA polymerase sigma factor [Bacteroidetes Order II. Incertae sedis bacterium]|jgi:RNA polymerase sigma factor FliA|nr:sigma-70 family RNA polymerase sigma factor [Bacteroidetes Order II. bacterium]HAY35507.1 FliA/WhiG family RNA polymerase sigma factor [Bacteroidota bacterium]MBT4052188.1 sigma-70 family RNA polymerase sigma factor [Bacteroidetes Order II. bacterium]MBT5250700.1 sigma-70 family RNA polymerase sigma factor [Bacteroidetes Order II. bacterium]MBT6201972.1 sigma-70 family RNA polymerase sigma factor [Bacteroidetes Order II. bacterium]